MATELTHEQILEARKSRVRVIVTYAAAAFLFGGGAVFIAFLIWTGRREDALDLFQTTFPVCAAIIAFWFGGRGRSQEKQGDDGKKP